MDTQNTQEPVLEQTGEATPTLPEAQPRKKRKALIIAIISIVFIALCVGGFFALSAYNTDRDEQLAFEILEGNENPQDYEDYLANFPDGKHAAEVKQRLVRLQGMLAKWQTIQLSERINDFVEFKNTYGDSQYARLCDIKIDSLDFVSAQRDGSEEAYQRYLAAHPDGRYVSEASIAQGQLRDQEVTPEDRDQIMTVLSDFFRGFETQDETLICSNIAATMTHFLNLENAHKAQVVSYINRMFNEHIQACSFIINRDIDIIRKPSADGQAPTYQATFTVDQHIQRDNEGKTFGSYRCTAEITSQLLITSLTMEDLTKE